MILVHAAAGKNTKNAMVDRRWSMSTKKSKPIPDDKEQSARFIEAAKRIDNPDAKAAFEEAMGKIVKKKKVSKS
jgi:hypothetical protein